MVHCVLSALRKPWPDPLGHHAITCSDNLLQDVVANLFRQAHMGVTVKVGYGLTSDNSHSCPSDVLINGFANSFGYHGDIPIYSCHP